MVATDTGGVKAKPSNEETLQVETTATTSAPKVTEVLQVDNTASIRQLICKDVWSDDVATVEDALRRIGDMCTKESNKAEIIIAGGHLAIIKAMEKNVLSANVQAEGSRAIQNIAVKMNQEEEHNDIVQVSSQPPVAAQASSSSFFPACCGSVLEQLECIDIKNFDHGPGRVSVSDEHLSRIIDAGGIGVIVSAMKTHPKDAKLQSFACGALYNISCERKYKSALTKEGAMGVLANAVENHPDVEFIQTWGRRTLRRLAA